MDKTNEPGAITFDFRCAAKKLNWIRNGTVHRGSVTSRTRLPAFKPPEMKGGNNNGPALSRPADAHAPPTTTTADDDESRVRIPHGVETGSPKTVAARRTRVDSGGGCVFFFLFPLPPPRIVPPPFT